MKLFGFVFFALFSVVFCRPGSILKAVAEIGTGIVTVPGGSILGGVGAFVGSGGDPDQTVQGFRYGAQQGVNVARNSGGRY